MRPEDVELPVHLGGIEQGRKGNALFDVLLLYSRLTNCIYTFFSPKNVYDVISIPFLPITRAFYIVPYKVFFCWSNDLKLRDRAARLDEAHRSAPSPNKTF